MVKETLKHGAQIYSSVRHVCLQSRQWFRKTLSGRSLEPHVSVLPQWTLPPPMGSFSVRVEPQL